LEERWAHAQTRTDTHTHGNIGNIKPASGRFNVADVAVRVLRGL
jgi:hypothetical protein